MDNLDELVLGLIGILNRSLLAFIVIGRLAARIKDMLEEANCVSQESKGKE